MSIPKDPKRYKLWKERIGKTLRKKYKNGELIMGKENNPMFGRHHSRKSKDKISKAKMGEKNPNFGKTGKGSPLFGKHRSQKIRDKISKSRIRKYMGKESPMLGKKCPDLAERNRQRRKERIQKICLVCGKDFKVILSRKNQKCCSLRCRGKMISENMKGSKNHKWKEKIRKTCPVCNKSFEVKPSEKNQICCLKKCTIKLYSGSNSHFYIDGRSFKPYSSEFNRQLKELIRHRDGYKCQKCGMPEIENIKKLSIHHIDYEKENCLPENLITLCGRCNTKVNKNRKKWTEYFQKKLKDITKYEYQA